MSNDYAQGSDEGQHDCARGSYCAARKMVVVEGGERVVVPAQTYRTFCEADRDRVGDCLKDLPRRYTELRARIGDRRAAEGPRVSGGGSTKPGPPINLGIDALVRQIEEITLSWDEHIRIVARRADLTAATYSEAVTQACQSLAAHLDAFLGIEPTDMSRTMDLARHEYLPDDATGWVHPSGEWIQYNTTLGPADAGTEIFNLHHRSLKMLGRTPQHHDLIIKCWECDERKLRRHDGSAGLADHVECQHCREQYLGSRLNSLMVEEDQAQKRKADRERRRADPKRVVLVGTCEGTGGRA